MTTHIAIVAEEGLQLDALLQAWEDSSVLQAFTPVILSNRDSGNSALFRNRPLAFRALEDVDAKSLRLVLVLASDRETQHWLGQLTCPVLGDASALQGLQAQLVGVATEGVLQVPHAATIALQQLLQNLSCKTLSATVMMPASCYGKRGVDELAAQTVRLLNAQAVNTRVFDRQLTFNSYPFAKEGVAQSLKTEWQALLQASDCYAALLQMPVFHGLAMQLSVEMADAEAVKKLLAHIADNEGFEQPEDIEDCSIMSAVQLDGQILVSNVEVSSVNPCRVDLWMAFDDVQLSVRKGLVCAAELLLKPDL